MIESPISIRPATPGDAQRIHELHMAAVRVLCAPHYAPKIIEGWLANRSAQGYLRGIGAGATIVAELASNVVGFGEGVPGEVVAVFVDPEFASRGIGSALLEHTLRLAHEHRGPVRLESTLNAVGFYERFGFAQVERSLVRRNRIEIPIVVMQRHASSHNNANCSFMRTNQSCESVKVEYLARHAEHVPVLASWVYDYWRTMYRIKSVEEQIGKLSERLNTDRFPLSFVAHIDSVPVGTASLKIQEMTTHEHYFHWLGTVYVRPENRGQGIGSLLIRHAEAKAQDLGVQTLYLHTPDKEHFYLNRGWEVIERPVYFDMKVALMRKKLTA